MHRLDGAGGDEDLLAGLARALALDHGIDAAIVLFQRRHQGLARLRRVPALALAVQLDLCPAGIGGDLQQALFGLDAQGQTHRQERGTDGCGLGRNADRGHGRGLLVDEEKRGRTHRHAGWMRFARAA
jgi:hypothetical protein